IFLINKLSQTGGLKTQGIFRLSVPVSELDHAIVLLNLNDYSNTFFSQVLTSPHAYAVLLKRWFKILNDPIIPYSLYEDALNIIRPPILKDANYKQISVNEFMNKKLPQTNNLFLKYLIRFLKDEYTDENMLLNMMVVQNFATILASTLIRSNQEDKAVDVDQLRLEISFIMTVFKQIDNLTKEEETWMTEAEKWFFENFCK
ncbi:MAG: hypothetical protein EZS28_043497, partial [Streblomastix strix]